MLHPSITIVPTCGSSGFKTNKITGPNSKHNHNGWRAMCLWRSIIMDVQPFSFKLGLVGLFCSSSIPTETQNWFKVWISTIFISIAGTHRQTKTNAHRAEKIWASLMWDTDVRHCYDIWGETAQRLGWKRENLFLVTNLTPTFEFKLCLTTLLSGQDVSACLATGYG